MCPVLVAGLNVSEWVHLVRRQPELGRLDRFQAISVSREGFAEDVDRLVGAIKRLRLGA